MDTRFTAEQNELQRSARQLARELGPATVADLDDATRTKRLGAAVRDAGWLELRDDSGDGTPLASGVEAAIVADALGSAVADAAFAGPLLAGDLSRRVGGAGPMMAVAFDATLGGVAVVEGSATSAPLFAVDCTDGATVAYVVVANGDRHRLATVSLAAPASATDLTRVVRTVPSGTPVTPIRTPGELADDDLVRWTALGLALTSADLVGAMRGVLDVTVAYAADRRQYDVPIGSFQAVQHLLAEARTLLDGSVSVAAYAAWTVDELEPAAARQAGRVAKAYCARAARTVCETAIQVHGGIGNTWECVAHVYLRRALLSTQWFGDDGEQLRALAEERLGAGQGGRRTAGRDAEGRAPEGAGGRNDGLS